MAENERVTELEFTMPSERITRCVNTTIKTLQNHLKLSPLEQVFILNETSKHLQKVYGLSIKGFDMIPGDLPGEPKPLLKAVDKPN